MNLFETMVVAAIICLLILVAFAIVTFVGMLALAVFG